MRERPRTMTAERLEQIWDTLLCRRILRHKEDEPLLDRIVDELKGIVIQTLEDSHDSNEQTIRELRERIASLEATLNAVGGEYYQQFLERQKFIQGVSNPTKVDHA